MFHVKSWGLKDVVIPWRFSSTEFSENMDPSMQNQKSPVCWSARCPVIHDRVVTSRKMIAGHVASAAGAGGSDNFDVCFMV